MQYHNLYSCTNFDVVSDVKLRYLLVVINLIVMNHLSDV